jgi:isocitrate/isopropylmalate dehydrogenase
MTKRVAVVPGDDAAPEAVWPSVALLKQLAPSITWEELPSGDDALATLGREGFARAIREAVDGTDTTLFGASSGKTPAAAYLRWGKDTYANVRPVRWRPGFNSPLKRPDGIDFVIVRENLEDLYVGIERDLSELQLPPPRQAQPVPMGQMVHEHGRGDVPPTVPRRGRDNAPIDTTAPGAFAVKIITEAATRRVARFACELALRRKDAGGKGKVTCATKHNVLPRTDGLFRGVAEAVVRDEYPGLDWESFIVDDFARRIVATPHDLDVVLMPNLYGDVLSDEAAGIIGGLGLAPSGCYGDRFAYFESVHGSAPDIAGRHIINPTATLLSAVLMLEYLGLADEARRLDGAVTRVYADGRHLTPDQGGAATTEEFCTAVAGYL